MNQLLPDIRNFEVPKKDGGKMRVPNPPENLQRVRAGDRQNDWERKGEGVVDSSNWRALRVWFHVFNLDIYI